MKSLLQEVEDVVQDACERIGIDRSYGSVTISNRPDLAQFQCNGAFAAAKEQKKNPREIAQDLLDVLKEEPLFSDLSIAGPGFLNITLRDDFLGKYITQYHKDDRCGVIPVEHPKKITIDFGGLNIAKPMHIGHVRSLVIGESLQRILRFLGHSVISDTHLGDFGTQMGILIIELQLEHPEWIYFDSSYTGEYPKEAPFTIDDVSRLYPVGSKKAKEDPDYLARAQQATMELQQKRKGYYELWKQIVTLSTDLLQEEIGFLDIHFDFWYGESRYHERIPDMMQRLEKSAAVKKSNGALIVDFGDRLQPCVIQKSDGAYLYSTTDLAAIDERVNDLKQEILLYVVDMRQQLHFQQVFEAAKETELIPQETTCVHVGFGTVNGKDGKPFKTRSGDSVRLRDVFDDAVVAARKKMQENNVAQSYDDEEKERIAHIVGMSAIQFSDLATTRTQEYIFDIDRMVQFEGKTGPYILYTTVRLQSILNKAAEQGLSSGAIVKATDGDRDLLLQLVQFPEIVSHAAKEYFPHILAEHLYAVAKAANQFYQACPILKETNKEQQAAWLALTEATLVQLRLGLSLLGIRVPDRM